MAGEATVTRVIEVDVKASANAAAHIAQIASGMNGLEKTANDTKSAMSTFFDTVSNSAKAFIGVFAANKATEIVLFFNSLSDASKMLHSRMQLVTGSTEAAGAAFSEITRISMAQGRELDATAKLYEKVARNADQLGIATRGISMVTEGFAASLRLSGAGTQEANAAMVQFSQALASGRLQGDEFRSLMENNSVFMFELAKAAGVTQGALREMSKDGKLNAEFLRETLFKLGTDGQNMLQRLTTNAEKLPQTFDQAKEGIKTALTDLISALGVTAQNAEGMFTRMLRAVQGSMTSAARAIREEAEIAAAVAKAMGEKTDLPKKDALLDADGQRNAQLTDRQNATRTLRDQQEKKRQQLLDAGLKEDSSAISQLNQNITRMQATIEAIDVILAKSAEQREKRVNGPLLVDGWKPTAAKAKHGKADNDPIAEMKDYLDKVDLAQDLGDEYMGKYEKKFEEFVRKIAMDTPKMYTVAQIAEFLKVGRAQAQALDSDELESNMVKFLGKVQENDIKRSLKDWDTQFNEYETKKKSYITKGRNLNPLVAIEDEITDVGKVINAASTSPEDKGVLEQYMADLRLRLAKELLGVKEVIKPIADQMGDAFAEGLDKATDSLLSFSKTGKEILTDFVTDFLRQWAKLEMKQAMAPLMEAGKSAIISLFKSADGSAFGPGGVRMFADGGVVTQPTGFNYAGGQGVMGEAGPEAIMPLRRGADGKLGVGSTPVTVNVINNGSNTKATTEESTDAQGQRQITVLVEDAVERAIGSGRMDKVMARSYNLNRKGN